MWFSFSSEQHNYESSKTNRQGKYSITVSAVELWNQIQKQLKDMLPKDLLPNKIKRTVTGFYL